MTDKSQNTHDRTRLFYLKPGDLTRRLKEGSPLFVLDVRNPPELEGESGRLAGAVNIPLHQLKQRLGELSELRERDILVVCRSGKRSEAAARMLQESGIERVFVLEGGMIAWRDTQR